VNEIDRTWQRREGNAGVFSRKSDGRPECRYDNIKMDFKEIE
jgi:hypothetical protein